jgi:hypothetical protein
MGDVFIGAFWWVLSGLMRRLAKWLECHGIQMFFWLCWNETLWGKLGWQISPLHWLCFAPPIPVEMREN